MARASSGAARQRGEVARATEGSSAILVLAGARIAPAAHLSGPQLGAGVIWGDWGRPDEPLKGPTIVGAWQREFQNTAEKGRYSSFLIRQQGKRRHNQLMEVWLEFQSVRSSSA